MGYNVKRLREILGVKQEDLAERLQLSQQSVSKLENREELDDESLEKIAAALNIPVEAIRNFTDDWVAHVVVSSFLDPCSMLCDNATFHNIKNMIEKIVQLYDEKEELYERMLVSEREKVALLEEFHKDKSTPDVSQE